MTTGNLNAVLFKELSSIATDEELLQKAIKCIKALKKEAKAKNAKRGEETCLTIQVKWNKEQPLSA